MENSKSKKKFDQISVYLLVAYIISLFIFVDNPSLVIISKIIFVLFALSSCVSILERKKIFLDKIFILIFLFLFICIISYFWAIEPSDVTRKIILLCQLLLLLFFITQVVLSTKHIEILLLGIGISGVFLFGYAVYLYGINNLFESILTGKRIGGEISQENTMGRLSALSTVALFIYALEKNKKIFFVITLIPFIMLLASGSRTAIIIMVIGILSALIAKNGFKKMYRLIIIFPLIGVLFYFAVQLSIFNSIKVRFLELSLSLNGAGGDGTMRINMIKWGWEWFLQSPIIGYGIGNYENLLYEKILMETYAHNNMIELLVGLGLIGFLLYYSIYFYILRNLYLLIKIKTSNAINLFSIFLIWFAAEVGAVNYTSKMTYVVMGISIAFIRLNKR